MKIQIITIMLAIGLCAGVVGCKRVPTAQAADVNAGPDNHLLEEKAYEDGRKQAEEDIRKGSLGIRSIGLPGESAQEYSQLLASRYGIRYGSFGCAVGPGMEGQMLGYNSVMRAEIAKRFGEDALAKTEADAILQHLENRKR